MTRLKVNYRKGMRAILDHLHGLGHRRLAFVGHHTTLGPLHERRQAFLKTAATYTPKVRVMTVANADGMLGGQHATREILASGFAPTAIVCVNDVMAVGVLHELRSRGIAVPRDIAVTGFDNVGLAEFTVPGLTTADIPREQIGRMICASLLATSRSARNGDPEVLIETTLVVRESTGPAPRAASASEARARRPR
jgi:LacI family transcriptional regulator